MNIVIIDDNINLVSVMAELIEMSYPESIVHTANTGISGISLIKRLLKEKRDIFLVIVDIRLPDISGFDIIREIHNLEITINSCLFTGFDLELFKSKAEAQNVPLYSKSTDITEIITQFL